MTNGNVLITLGQNLSAYAVIEVPADTDLSDANLIEIAKKKAYDDTDTVIDEDWSTTNGLRVVCLTKPDGSVQIRDLVVDPPDFAPMSLEEKRALEWARSQDYGSVAVRYAKLLANYITRAVPGVVES